ncbi:MAG: tetratricopeptide repeat protein, partial [Pseudomonas sp.]
PQSFAFQHSAETPRESQAGAARPLQSAAPLRRGAETRARPAAARVARPAPNNAKPQPLAAKAGAPAQLESIASLANQGRLDEARQGCERYLAEHGPGAEAFYWLGLLSDAGGKPQEAQGYYRKALYLQPQHREALAHLATLLAAQGDAAGARRLQERAARGVSKDG